MLCIALPSVTIACEALYSSNLYMFSCRSIGYGATISAPHMVSFFHHNRPCTHILENSMHMPASIYFRTFIQVQKFSMLGADPVTSLLSCTTLSVQVGKLSVSTISKN